MENKRALPRLPSAAYDSRKEEILHVQSAYDVPAGSSFGIGRWDYFYPPNTSLR